MKKLGLLITLFLSLAADLPSWAQTKKTKPGNSAAIQDSLRRQGLQKSADEWARRYVLPQIRGSVRSVHSFGVIVREPKNTLPPDLGGPIHFVKIQVEVRVNATLDRYDRYYDSRYYGGFPDSGECRVIQNIWAHVDKSGRPIKVMANQAPVNAVACMSPGVPPRYHDDSNYRF